MKGRGFTRKLSSHEGDRGPRPSQPASYFQTPASLQGWERLGEARCVAVPLPFSPVVTDPSPTPSSPTTSPTHLSPKVRWLRLTTCGANYCPLFPAGSSGGSQGMRSKLKRQCREESGGHARHQQVHPGAQTWRLRGRGIFERAS